MMEDKNILEITDLNLFFHDFQALKHIDMKIPRGKVTALIGPSGCGKSTFLKCLNRMSDLVDGVNARPVYTLAALRGLRDIAPERVWLVGGPAERLRERLAGRLALPVDCPPHAPVANAVGAALTLPTAGLEVYADSGRALLRVPSLELEEKLPRAATLETVKERAVALLEERLAVHDAAGARVEVVEADLFAVLDDSGRASRDMRVRCQAVPGITGQVGTAG